MKAQGLQLSFLPKWVVLKGCGAGPGSLEGPVASFPLLFTPLFFGGGGSALNPPCFISCSILGSSSETNAARSAGAPELCAGGCGVACRGPARDPGEAVGAADWGAPAARRNAVSALATFFFGRVTWTRAQKALTGHKKGMVQFGVIPEIG